MLPLPWLEPIIGHRHTSYDTYSPSAEKGVIGKSIVALRSHATSVGLQQRRCELRRFCRTII
eukprot:scaffold8721_cov80-Phaeocystis_antarctica.AAC.22